MSEQGDGVEGRVMTHCVPNEHVAIADEPEFSPAK